MSFWRRKRDHDIDRELRDHLDLEAEDQRNSGLSEDNARYAAQRALGNDALIKEDTRAVWKWIWLEQLGQDLRYALRTLRRSPGFAAVAVLSLGLGIGANTAIFSLADAVLLNTIPVQEPRQLVEITRVGGGSISYPLYRHIQEGNGVFSNTLIMSAGRFTASLRTGSSELGDIQLSPVSGDYFSVLGVTPVIGRALAEQDMVPSSTAVIGYRLWRERFRGDPSVIGTVVHVGARPYTIVGVAPAGFNGVLAGHSIDLWLPITWFDRAPLENPVAFMFRSIARLKPGVSEREAQANVELLARQWSDGLNFDQPVRLELTTASGGLNMLRRRFGRPLWVLMGIVTLLLLCAAVNVANLLLVRAAKRHREMAIRLSIGAGRGRLIRQLLTESFVLAALGGALGLVIAPVAARSLLRFLASAMGPMTLNLSIDPRMLAFTAGISFAVALFFGLAPALAATRQNRSPVFRGGFSSRTAAPHAGKSGKLLVVAQVAISCVLLSVAVLFARSLHQLAELDMGFERENVLILSVEPPESGLESRATAHVFSRVLDRLATVPGVRSAALSSEALLGGGRWTEAIAAPGFNPVAGQNRDAVMLIVSPHFFRTMGTRLLAGRDFDSRDNELGPRAAVVNEAMARYFLGRPDAVGLSFQVAGSPQPLTVVGVVEDARFQTLRDAAPPIVYLPYTQGPIVGTNLAIRTVGDPEKMAGLLSGEIRREAPVLRIRRVVTQAQLVDGATAQDRMLAQLSGAFGLAGALLVCLGLFGVTAYDVSRRTAEFGIRIALGAQPSSVARMVVRQAIVLVGSGVGFGMVCSVAVTRIAERLVFGVRALDAASLLPPALMLLAIGVAAAYVPARRAASADPATALRWE